MGDILISSYVFLLRYTSKMLLAAIDETHKGTYDFLYLPIDFKVMLWWNIFLSPLLVNMEKGTNSSVLGPE